MTLLEKYQSAKKLLLRTREGLDTLEKLEYTMGMDTPDEALFFSKNISEIDSLYKLSLSVENDIFQIQSLCTDMNRLWHSADAESLPNLWKRKVEHVVEEAESVRESLDKYNLRNKSRMRAAREKAELLGRVNGEPARVLRIFGKEAQTMQSVDCYNVLGGETAADGDVTHFKYSEQREHLKRAQRRAVAGRNKKGLSYSVYHGDSGIRHACSFLIVLILVLFLKLAMRDH